jgi:hypothetical protein
MRTIDILHRVTFIRLWLSAIIDQPSGFQRKQSRREVAGCVSISWSPRRPVSKTRLAVGRQRMAEGRGWWHIRPSASARAEIQAAAGFTSSLTRETPESSSTRAAISAFARRSNSISDALSGLGVS